MYLKKSYLFILTIIVFTLLFYTKTLAHGSSQSFPKDVGIYTIEMEYDAQGVFDDLTTPFVFRILDQKTKNPVVFDSVLVRFERKSDKSTIIVARVVPDEFLEGVGRLTAMLNQGDYNVTLIFYKKDSKLTEADYDLTVNKGETKGAFPIIPFISGIGGLVVGFVIAKSTKARVSQNE